MRDKPYFEPTKDNVKVNRGNMNKYCEYNGSAGHSTETCWDLMDMIEKNVQNGALVQYVVGREVSGAQQENNTPVKNPTTQPL